MLTVITAGLAIGILGSFHCVGMCGPLAISLPLQGRSNFSKFLASFFYNAGRVITYSLLGLLFGLVGHSIALFGYQQLLSILIGAVILLFLLTKDRFNGAGFNIPYVARFFAVVRKRLGNLYRNKNFSAVFFIGLLNGLLPCGLVYMAIAGALATGDVINSMVFMASFGLGTLPLMWAVSFFGSYISVGLRVRIRRLQPYLLGLLACLLILRGIGLGIPYISPKINTGSRVEQHCNPTP